MSDRTDWPRYQDVAGQLPSLQGYTQFCLLFPLRDSSPPASNRIVQQIKTTSERLVILFPWLSGQVVNEGGERGSSGTFKIIAYKPYGESVDIIVKEHEVDYQTVADAKAPMYMLDGEEFSPRWDLSRLYDLTQTSAPVLVIQLNFLRGGLVITFAAAHNAVDMSGLARIIRVFARLYRGEEVHEKEIEGGNMDRRTLLRLLGQDEMMLDHHMIQQDQEQDSSEDKPLDGAQEPRWAYIRFDKASLESLKGKASHPPPNCTCKDNTHAEWISTDDALSAFIWQRVTLARHGSSFADQKSVLCRAINARRFLQPKIPDSYMGHMVACAHNSFPLHSLLDADLCCIAATLRQTLSEQSDHSIRSFFSFINEQRDKNRINFAAHMDLSRDVLLSSGAGLDVYHADFGPPLYTPELVRRPKWYAAEGVAYFMPKTPAGEVDVALCLKEDDWSELLGNEAWAQVAQYIG